MDRQEKFDFSRGDQLGIIDRAVLPSVQLPIDSDKPGAAEKNRVSGGAMKGVLRVIDSYGRGKEAWPSEPTIAREANYKLRTVKRAIAGLQKLLVLIVDYRISSQGYACNHYRIVYSNLEDFIPKADRAPGPPSSDRGASSASEISWRDGADSSNHGAGKSGDGADSSKPSADPAPKAYISAKEPPPPRANQAVAGILESCPESEWASVETALRAIVPRFERWPTAIREAKSANLKPAAMLAIVDQFNRHKSKFAGPGAILDRIRSGCWCVSIPTEQDEAAARLRALERQRQKAIEYADYEKRKAAPMEPWTEEELVKLRGMGVKL